MTSYCSGCGASLPEVARYCSGCGKAVAPISSIVSLEPRSPIIRPRFGRKVAGVCQGIANHFGWDANLVRLAAVILTIGILPVGLASYALLWVLLPEEVLMLPTITTLNTTVSS